jgi:hypothetical protein
VIPETITPLSDHLRTLDARYRNYENADDRVVASACTCSACGHHGLGYRGFMRPAQANERRSYRAFVVCGDCGHAEEF